MAKTENMKLFQLFPIGIIVLINQIVYLNTVNHIDCTWTITSPKSYYLGLLFTNAKVCFLSLNWPQTSYILNNGLVSLGPENKKLIL